MLIRLYYKVDVKNENVDVLILGCTHYPVIADLIGDIMGRDVTLISAGAEAAKFTKQRLEEMGLLSGRTEKGKNTYYVSDSTEMFEENAVNFLHENVHGDVFRSDF